MIDVASSSAHSSAEKTEASFGRVAEREVIGVSYWVASVPTCVSTLGNEVPLIGGYGDYLDCNIMI